jgi:hypothetical protein
MRIAPAMLASIGFWVAATSADSYTVTIDPAVRAEPANGRLMLFFITASGRGWDRAKPARGPFYHRPQPIASIAVTDLKPGDSASIDGSVFAFPASLDTLDGRVRVQAVLDLDQTERSHLEGPGNLTSEVVALDVSSARDDQVTLTLNQRVERHELPAAQPDSNLRWVELRSELLSAFYGRDIFHRAGIALPPGYLDPQSPRTEWPAIYVVPGFGGRIGQAREIASMLKIAGPDMAPHAVWIVLDPESPLGHHGFVDSPNHGPRGSALVKEFIPWLESQLRLAAKPDARILTGHSSGGWSSLWLQLQWPEVFGACWSSAPDPVDFSAFQMSDIYHDANLYVDATGREVPSFREQQGPGLEAVLMTVREEGLMEHAMDPEGRSGEQWDAWEAMFSPHDEATGLPVPLFDALTGAIDHDIAAQWSRFDITRLVSEDWARHGPIITQRVRLAVGSLDSFYLNRAVERLKAKVDALNTPATGPGYIWIVPHATHGNIERFTTQRWNEEMIHYLRERGLGE